MTLSPRKSATLQFVLLVLLVVIFLNIGRFFHLDEEWYKSLLTGAPLALSGVIFVVLYVVVTSLVWLGPKDFFRISSALIYGPYISTLFVYIAEVINAFIFFQLSRKFGRGFVESKLQGKMKSLDEKIATASFWWIFAMRLFIVPFRFLDMGCGLTRIPFQKYFLIVLLGTPLRLFLFQYLLSLGMDVVRDPVKLADHLSANPLVLWFNVAYLIGAVAVLFFLRKK